MHYSICLLVGTSGKGGYEPKPFAVLKQCLAAASLSVVDKNTKFKRLLLQHRSHGHGKDERAETADQMLDRILDEMNTAGKGQGEKSGTRPPDSTRRSSMEREVGEGVRALTGAGEKEA